jgi:hypothetical protein
MVCQQRIVTSVLEAGCRASAYPFGAQTCSLKKSGGCSSMPHRMCDGRLAVVVRGLRPTDELRLTELVTGGAGHSPKVAGAGCFGAALMMEPELVADCAAAIAQGGQVGLDVATPAYASKSKGYTPATRLSCGVHVETWHVW